jgi:hypothetical protein
MKILRASVALLLAITGSGCPVDPKKDQTDDTGNVIQGKVEFEYRLPTVNNKNQIVLQSDTNIGPARGLKAVLVDQTGNVLGSTTLDRTGAFKFTMKKPLQRGEKVLVAPVLESSQQQILFAVLDGSTAKISDDETEAIANLWAWSIPVPKSGKVGTSLIKEDQGSGAIFIFSLASIALRDVAQFMLDNQPDNLKPIAYIWAPGEELVCPACYLPPSEKTPLLSITGSSTKFDQFIFIGGKKSGSSAWGSTVLLHELGHYVAHNYSRDDSRGGEHYLGKPIAPAFAWSEGWASFFAVSTMGRWIGEPFPIFWDIQENQSMWLNYNEVRGSDSGAVKPPDSNKGIDQKLDESFVASALYNLWDGNDVAEIGDDDGIALGTASVFSAIASPRFVNLDRGAQGADLVDFVDEAICAALEMSTRISEMLSEFGFPYNANHKICQ